MKRLTVSAATIITTLGISAVALAQEGSAVANVAKSPWIPVGVGLGLGLAALGSALGQGRTSAAAMEGISRNPAASGKIFTPLLICLAFMEAITIFTWLVARDLAGKV